MFHKDHPVQFWSIVAVCVTVVLTVSIISKHSIEAAKIQAEQTVKEREITEKQQTERTEERSQFWQKLVPWGRDEEEQDQ